MSGWRDKDITEKREREYRGVMPLSEESIEEFRTLWKQEFGEEISKEYASIRAREIVALYEDLLEVTEKRAVRDVREEKEEGRRGSGP